jgi:hypothetical protein
VSLLTNPVLYPFPLAFLVSICVHKQEQEQEMEIEKEQVRVETAKPGRTYSRDQEAPTPWPLAALSEPPSKGLISGSSPQGFYAASSLSVKTWHSTTAPLSFPPYCLVSKNHYNSAWSLKTYRRLKNVMVMLEWIPAEGDLALMTEELPLTKQQQLMLTKAFKLLDADVRVVLSIDFSAASATCVCHCMLAPTCTQPIRNPTFALTTMR